MAYFDGAEVAAGLRGLLRDERSLFEREFAEYIGAKHALGTSYGRTALYLGLRAIGVRGREVLLPGFVCSVVRHAVVAAGAIPRFVDLDPATLELDLADLRSKITSRAKAVLVIHYFGRVARQAGEAARIARDHGLLVVEDCAHTLGAVTGGHRLGGEGDFSIFSLTKSTLNAGGGVLVTDQEAIAGKARELRASDRVSGKERLADFPIVAAYGLEQAIAKLYLDRIRRHRESLMRWPAVILRAREYSLRLLRRRGPGGEGPQVGVACGGAAPAPLPWGYRAPMEPLLAALGRAQLRKIDMLNRRRQRIAGLLGLAPTTPVAVGGGAIVDTQGFVVLRFKGRDLGEVVRLAGLQGLTLRSTWPTRQKLWEGQGTAALQQIARELCTWCVNPDLTDLEASRFREIAGALGAQFPFATAERGRAA